MSYEYVYRDCGDFSQMRDDDLEATILRRERFEMLDPQFSPPDEHKFDDQLDQFDDGKPTPLRVGQGHPSSPSLSADKTERSIANGPSPDAGVDGRARVQLDLFSDAA